MSELKKYDLMELPWTDIAEYIKAGNDVVMIPVGSCEKHGHHVPLGVDSYTTMGSVERAAEKAKVLYSPLLPFGLSPHHMGQPGWGTGSISLPAEIYRDVLYAIGRSLIFCGLQQAGLRLPSRHQHGGPGRSAAHAAGRNRLLLRLLQDADRAGLRRGCRPDDRAPGRDPGLARRRTGNLHLHRLYEGKGDLRRIRFSWSGPNRTAPTPRSGWDRPSPRRMGPIPSSSRVPRTSLSRCSTTNTRIRLLSGTPCVQAKSRATRFSRGSVDHLAAFLEEVKKFDFKVPAEKRDWPGRFWRG